MVAASVTRFNFLKHVQHFDVQSSKRKKEKKKKYSIYNFSEHVQDYKIF